ncbi:MAG: hypothetical protein IKY61_08620, partial [Thermoguttaceae bacterium]|nr:hypothetical protein [Thermoguttaceae bacterium]
MLEFFSLLASQTLRGSFYIVFMLTLQHLLRNQLSPRVRAALWAPLLIALLAPQVCVVRVPVSQPVETTVVDALEQTRAALTSDVVKSAPEFGLRRVDGRSVVYLPPKSFDTGPFKTVAPPFEKPSPESAWDGDAEADVWEAETNEEIAPGLADADVFSQEIANAPLPETPTTIETAETPAPTFENFFEQPFEEAPKLAAVEATPPTAVETPELAAAPVSTAASSSTDGVRSGWFQFFEVAAFVFLAVWAFGLVVAFVYLVRSADVCRRWIQFSAPVEDADVLALYRRCADSLEIDSPPRLATTTDLTSPALLGWRRPVVLVPSEYVDALSEERLTHVLLHELGHFKRGDAATGFLAFFVLATHWFNPLFWLAARSFHATREEACDALALGSSALTAPNSAAEYARTLCEIAGNRPFVEQAFGAVGFSPTFRSLRRRVETLGRFGTWGRRAAFGCLLASFVASAFATVRLLPDVEKAEQTKATSDEETSVVRKRARAAFAALPALPQRPVPKIAPTDPIAAVDVATLYQDEADRLFFGHSTEERQAFVADAVAKIRSAKAQGEAEHYAALGDYLIRESAFFWLLAGVDAVVRDDAIAASAELPALIEGETPADHPKSVSSTELDAALARAEKTADPNFRYLAELHRALADKAKRDYPARYRANYAESLDAFARSPFWRAPLTPRPCLALQRELETGAYFLAEAAAQGNGDAAASLARYIENYSIPDFAPSGFVAEVGRRNGITENDLKSKTADERPATVAKVAFLYALAGAEAGSPQAQGLVASYYARGFGVERNVAEALRWGERFYDVDAPTGSGYYVPLTRCVKAKLDPATGSLVPQTLAELNANSVREFRRLAPLSEILLCSANDLRVHGALALGALSRQLFVENGVCAFARLRDPEIKNWATFLLLAEAALDSEPTPENLALAEKFLSRANSVESRSFFFQTETPNGRDLALDHETLRLTPGFVEANERLAEAFADGSFGVKDVEKANQVRFVAQNFAKDKGTPAMLAIEPHVPRKSKPTPVESAASPTAGARHSFVAPQTPEFEAVIAPIFAKLEKTLVDAKNGNAAALTPRFNEYFDDATDLYPNGRSGTPEVARYKAERLTQEIERLEKADADAPTLKRLRE